MKLKTALLAGVTLAAGCLTLAGAAGAAGMASASTSTAVAALAAPAAPQAAATVSGNWGDAHEIPGLATLSGGRDTVVESLSCRTAGNCAVGGYYLDASGDKQPFVANEKNGAWGNAQPVAGAVGIGRSVQGEVTAVSCASADNCAATGTVSFADSTGPDGDPQSNPAGFFVVDERNGVWGTAASGVTGAIALGVGDFHPRTISCAPASPGNCALGGDFTDNFGQQAFVMDETNGTWGRWEEIPGTAELNTRGSAGVASISCGGLGRCVAVGLLDTSSGAVALIAEESAGAWQLPEIATLIDPNLGNSVSCASGGNCAVVGTYFVASTGQTLGYVLDERNGTWGSPRPVPALNVMSTGGPAVPTTVSCATPGNCAASGTFSTAAGILPFVADEANGTWGNAIEIPGDAAFRSNHWVARSVSCAGAGTCAVTGGYEVVGTGFHVFVADESSGTWGNVASGKAPLQASPGLGQVSCGSAGTCALAGTYTDVAGRAHAFVDDESTAASAALTVSAANVNYGQEQAAHLTIKVTPRTGGTPAGTVTLNAGPARLATVSLNAAAGAAWVLPAKMLKPGTYQLTASYASSNGYDGATSAAVKLIVAKPVSVVAAALSAARVKAGHENAARLSVKVTSPAGGIPAGKVTIKAGATALVTLALSKAGTAGWTLPASRLKPGTYQLTVSYASSNGYQPATSAKKQLVVTK
jgi:Big-like domain-containing protein